MIPNHHFWIRSLVLAFALLALNARLIDDSSLRVQTSPVSADTMAESSLGSEVSKCLERPMSEGADTLAVESRAQTPAANPASGYPALSDALSAAVHSVRVPRAVEQQLEVNKDVRYWVTNPAELMTARFLDDKVTLRSSSPGSTWSLSVKRPGVSPQLSASGNRVEYHHKDGVLEWYENGVNGIQQGFRVANSLPDSRSEEGLRIILEVDGLSAAEEGNDGQSLCFTDPEGRALVAYRGLKAWDAKGRVLDASMRPSADGMMIVVNDTDAVYPVEIDPFYLNLEQSLLPVMTGTGDPSDNLGSAVALSGNTAVVGAPGAGAGRIYVFVNNGSLWTLEAELWAPDGKYEDLYGSAVDLEGDTLAVGAFKTDLPGAEDAGCVFVYHRSGGVWTQQAKLTAPSPIRDGWFGVTLSLSGDDLVVGSIYNGANLFRRTGTAWSHAFTPPPATGAWGFGRAVAISGNTMLISATIETVNLVQGAGTVYVWERSGGIWQETKRLVAPHTPLTDDNFGSVLALDGDVAVIGAPMTDDKFGGYADYGAAYIFRRNGADWLVQATYRGTMQPPDGSGERMGSAVAVSGDRVVIGTPGNLSASLGVGGMVNNYQWNGTTWVLRGSLSYPSRLAGDKFGNGVAVEGNTLIVGAPGHQGAGGAYANFGSAFVYGFSTTTGWSLKQSLTAGDGRVGIRLGTAVTLKGDTALVGAPSESGLVGSAEGAAYVFVRVNNRWQQQARLAQPNPSSLLYFGRRVALDGDTAVVGSADATTTVISKGAAEVFVRNVSTWSHQQTLNATGQANASGFGSALAVLGDNLLVGSPYADNSGPGLANGNAYWFQRVGTAWTQKQVIAPTSKQDNQNFGASIDLDGTTAIIGGPGSATSGWSAAGLAYVFGFNGTTLTWSQQAALSAPTPSASANFGKQVAIQSNTIVVGATGVDGPEATGFPFSNGGLGQAYVYTKSGATSWSLQATLNPEGTSQTTAFGFAVALDGNNAVIGTEGQFAAYLFTRSGTSWTRSKKYQFESQNNAGDFGQSVAVDGTTVLIGVPGANRTEVSLNRVYASQGMVQVYRISNAPSITVTNSDGAVMADGGGLIGFGGTTMAKSISQEITITNTADAPLTGLSLTVSGADAAMFAISGWTSSPLAVGEQRKLTARFQPTKSGECTATLQIASSNTLDGTYDVFLVGTGLSPRDAFNQWALGLPDVAASGVPFSDGVANLVKYAFNMNGGAADRRMLVPGTGMEGLPVCQLASNGATRVFRFEYLRRKGSGLVYTPEASTSLNAGTFTAPAGTMTVSPTASDDWERVVHEIPLATSGNYFMRVRIDLP